MVFELKDQLEISFLVDHFNVPRSSYYRWLKTKDSDTVQLATKVHLCSEIKKVFNASKGTYGSPRVYAELKDKGLRISENTVAKYMKELGLDARLKQNYRVFTTNSKHNYPIADRVFKTELSECMPNGFGEVLAGDITYLKLGKCDHVYLAVVIDLYNREVVGWSMSRSLKTRLVLNALHMATRSLGNSAKVVFHSDRGVQYASDAFRSLLKNLNVTPSMSRKGNCYDNAYVESFFSSLKKECVYREKPETEEEMRSAVFKYIETWYNKTRRHSALDYMSPLDYKIKYQRTS